MVLSLFLVTLLGVPFSGAAEHGIKFTALQFPDRLKWPYYYSHIRMFPDFRPFARAVSACGWLKSLGSAAHSTVFTFHGYEMLVSHNGKWFCILGRCSLVSNVPPQGEW